MMQGRIFVSTAVKSSSRFMARTMATEAAAPSTQLTLNFVTPHAPIYSKKIVSSVQVPGAGGEYGITAGHSPIISELKPGVVVVHHLGGEVEKFFVSGGFSLTHANSTTDLSVPEAVPIADLDDHAIRSALEESRKQLASSGSDAKASAIAQISIDTFSAMLRALGQSA